eukprot:658938-Amphidinium_carterae.1
MGSLALPTGTVDAAISMERRKRRSALTRARNEDLSCTLGWRLLRMMVAASLQCFSVIQRSLCFHSM